MEDGSNPDVQRLQTGYLSDILKYATENVAFYKEFKAFDSIHSFPVITKNILRDNFNAFQSPEFSRASVISMHTGGSTGIPSVARQDRNKRNRVYAEMMYFWGKAGYQIGMRYVFFRIWTPDNRKSKLTAWARNILMLDIKNLDDINMEIIRNNVRRDNKIRVVLGYPNALENLADYLLACGDTPDKYKIVAVITVGEALPEITREKLKKLFDCTVVSLYSNQENGMLAQECVENKEFHVNSASYYVELLRMDSDDQVGVGETGRIIVTDLFNHAMPLIRFDTGDIGIWKQKSECGWHSQVLSAVQGRLMDQIYDTKGNKKSPNAIGFLMMPFEKLSQYQFIQEGAKQYTLKLNGAEGHYEDATFVELFQDFLGKDAYITIEHVKEIPVLASGKRKKVMSNYVKENA